MTVYPDRPVDVNFGCLRRLGRKCRLLWLEAEIIRPYCVANGAVEMLQRVQSTSFMSTFFLYHLHVGGLAKAVSGHLEAKSEAIGGWV